MNLRENGIIQYDSNLKLIDRQSQDPQPVILSEKEYKNVLRENDLIPGFLSDVGILKAMELGLIKIGGEGFDIQTQIQEAHVDLRLGNEFWHYQGRRVSVIDVDDDPFQLCVDNVIDYDYASDGEKFVFHPGRLILAQTKEWVSLSNVVIGMFDGKSKMARFGVSNHQSAERIHPGFSGPITMELSNANEIDVSVRVARPAASIGFVLLSSPSSRPRSLDPERKWAGTNGSPFGFRAAEWEIKKQHEIGKNSKTT